MVDSRFPASSPSPPAPRLVPERHRLLNQQCGTVQLMTPNVKMVAASPVALWQLTRSDVAQAASGSSSSTPAKSWSSGSQSALRTQVPAAAARHQPRPSSAGARAQLLPPGPRHPCFAAVEQLRSQATTLNRVMLRSRSQPLVPDAWAAPLAQLAVSAPDDGASDADESTHEDVALDVDASAASPAASPTPMRPPSAPSGRSPILLGLSGRPSSASPHLSRGPRGDTSAAGDIGRDRCALIEHQQRIGTDPKYGAAHFYLHTGVLPETLKRKPMPKGQRLPGQKTPKQLEDARVAAAQKERDDLISSLWDRVHRENPSPTRESPAPSPAPSRRVARARSKAAYGERGGGERGGSRERGGGESGGGGESDGGGESVSAERLHAALHEVRQIALELQTHLEELPPTATVEEVSAMSQATQVAEHGLYPGSALGFEGHLLHRGYPLKTVPTGYLYPERFGLVDSGRVVRQASGRWASREASELNERDAQRQATREYVATSRRRVGL